MRCRGHLRPAVDQRRNAHQHGLAARRALLAEPFADGHHGVAVVVPFEVEEHEVDERVARQRLGAGHGVDGRAAVGPARRGVLVGHEHAERRLAGAPRDRAPRAARPGARAAPGAASATAIATRHRRIRHRIRYLPLTRRFYPNQRGARVVGRVRTNDANAGAWPWPGRRPRYDGDVVRRLVALPAALPWPAPWPPPLPPDAVAGADHRAGAQGRRALPVDHHQQRRLPGARRGRRRARPHRPRRPRDRRHHGDAAASARRSSPRIAPWYRCRAGWCRWRRRRCGRTARMFVTPEFVTRALALLLEQRIEFRRAGRLLVLGDLRVPRVVVARRVRQPTRRRVVFEVSPATEATVTAGAGQLAVAFSADALDAALPSRARRRVPAGDPARATARHAGAGHRPALCDVIAPPPRPSTPARPAWSSICWPPAPNGRAGNPGSAAVSGCGAEPGRRSCRGATGAHPRRGLAGGAWRSRATPSACAPS